MTTGGAANLEGQSNAERRLRLGSLIKGEQEG